MTVEQSILKVNTSGHILAFNVSEERFMSDYAEDFCEWLDGTVIKISPVHINHNKIKQYLYLLIDAYFELRPIGKVIDAPFVMRYQYEEDGVTKQRDREPDIQVILDSNPNNLTPTFMDGAADIVIEIVSPESVQRDYSDKLYEYERAGVPEYWIIDPIKAEARFYHLNEKQAYVLQDTEDVYKTDRLPKLKLHIPTLWKSELPGPAAIVKMVQEMLAE